MKSADLLLNGRCTGPLGLVISPISAKAASYFGSSSEYNRNNNWNINFGSGNTNNNNKYNNNVSRAIVALEQQVMEGWVEAFEDCCLHKKSAIQCALYRVIASQDLPVLAAEIEILKTYEPGRSVSFIVTRPKLREIFAADFRDRIAQHWVCLRLRPFIEERFRSMGDVSFNCRVGYGTLAAVERAKCDIAFVTSEYTIPAWVATIDVWSFFMTIDKRVLWSRLHPFILSNADRIKALYPATDINTLIWLTEKIIMHCPQKNCIRKGNPALWDELPAWKSLFNASDWCGMPIGNITSQELANFLLSFIDEWAVTWCSDRGMRYVRFVDDFFVVSPNKEYIIEFRQLLADKMRKELNQQIHPDKFYIQRASHGVKYVGQVIKPGRRYTSNRTIYSLISGLRALESICNVIITNGIDRESALLLEHQVSSVNSLLGFLQPTASHRIRERMWNGLSSFWKVCYVLNGHIVKIRKKYKVRTIITHNYDEDISFFAAANRRGLVQ